MPDPPFILTLFMIPPTSIGSFISDASGFSSGPADDDRQTQSKPDGVGILIAS